ncbi:patellin-4 [Iris pallida]|uniref:Patellin-4 n=1 Tax=Iris pallida TaxID=29817 RepID=A0AAX6EME0_IRIPA|nr:patellin-4 [Iris pallida]
MTMEEVKPETAQVAEPVKASESNIEENADADAATIEENKNKTEESEEALKVANKAEAVAVESSFLSDLKDAEKKALAELKAKLEEAIVENKLFKKEDPKPPKENQAETKAEVQEEADKVVEQQISLWGVPLSPRSKDSAAAAAATDVLLLKFLRAREFKVKEAFDMLKNTLQWRRDNKIDSVLEETELGDDFGAACYMEGLDREGHPVCYNVVSAVFREEEVYKKAFGSKEGRERFLRWRVQLMEKGIQKLDMRPGGISKLLQITDLKDSVGPSKKELRDTMKQALQLLQDNYPEFVTRNIFINVPFWYYAFYALLSPFMTQRTKNKFVVTRSSNVTETLLKHIPAEAIPIQYGGFKRENDTVFSLEDDPVSELIVKASSTETIEIAAPKAGTTAVWDLSVLGWEVKYKEEFVPSDEGSYTIILQKVKKMGSQEEELLIRNSFMNNEPGKVVLTVENNTSKKKKVLFRYKTDQ